MPSIITIDGPGGSGKGTLARLVAFNLSWNILDSGAIYRILALAALERKINLNDVNRLCALAGNIELAFPYSKTITEIRLNGVDVTNSIRQQYVAEAASQVAVHAAVRDALVELQHDQIRMPGLVADGRDLGTIVFPHADLKIFLNASVEARAERRYKELIDAGQDVERSAILRDLEIRDLRDSKRIVAPLVPARDAFIIDGSEKTPAQVLAEVWELCSKKGLTQ